MLPLSRGREGRIGRYRLVRRMAAGGMADLYLGQLHGPAGYERTVVVKVLRGDLLDEEDGVSPLLDEARIGALLHHENVVRTLEVGEDNGTPFLAMEFVFGRTLRQVLDRCSEMGVGIPVPHVVTCLRDALAALDYAHRRTDGDGRPLGLVHRDVSPSNLMLGFDGTTRLLDFGLAKVALRTSATHAGVVKGSFAYMSPEQVRRKPLDGRSDLFSLGSVLWEALCGRRLFEASSDLETVSAVAAAKVPFPKRLHPHLPFWLSWLTWRSLRRRPSLRHRSAGAMLRVVEGRDPRSIDEARDELRNWLRALFHVELSTRDAALQRARGEPTRFRMLRDSGFELLPEVTDPAIPRPRSEPRPESPDRRRAWWRALRESRWAGMVGVALLFAVVGWGVYLARPEGKEEDVGYIYVLADRPAEVTVGPRSVGSTPVVRVRVEAGRYQVVARSEGSEERRWVEVKAGQNRLVKFEFRR